MSEPPACWGPLEAAVVELLVAPLALLVAPLVLEAPEGLDVFDELPHAASASAVNAAAMSSAMRARDV